MSDSINALGGQLAAAEAHVAALRAQILGRGTGTAAAANGSVPNPAPAPLKLDLGCGNTERRKFTNTPAPEWTGVDIAARDGVDQVADLRQPWPWADNSVDEVVASHIVEHIPGRERIHFFNELWRVLKPGGKALVTTPHWASCRAYGDPTHEWPPVSEMLWSYLDPSWRTVNAAHVGFVCDFVTTYGYSVNPALNGRNPDYVRAAVSDHKEAAQDMIATLTKRSAP